MANRWDITDDIKLETLKMLREVMRSKNERTRALAGRIVVSMDALNQKDEHFQLREMKEKLIELAAELGLPGEGDCETPESEEGSSHPRTTGSDEQEEQE